MARRLLRVLLGIGLALLIVAISPPGADVARAQYARPKYQVTGFRDARFGMTLDEVRPIARKDFNVDDGQMTLTTDAATGASKLVVHVHDLEPGLGIGRVEYLFSYREHGLFQVNVVWGLDTNPQLDNSGMLAAAMRLQGYFLGFDWAIGTVRTAVPLEERAAVLFTGADRSDGAASVTVEDAGYRLIGGGQVRLLPEPSVPTIVTVTYTDQARAADMRTISRRDF
jgi:hypothetical protein